MDNKEIKFDDVASQARNWNFAGDNLLLQWMKQISQGLEHRANQTTLNLRQLHKNLKETDISLNNMANSLNALQYGNQFVESRVKDDDDILDNEIKAVESTNGTKNPLSPEAALEKFLDNNIKVLRNCYERYCVALYDDDDTEDDDEDMAHKKTFIYQPKNPYNERPLPHIINSKEWYQSCHVGLQDNKQDEMNEYSEDEKSSDLVYSEDDNGNEEYTKSYETNHASNMSLATSSSNSLQSDTFQRNFKVENASVLKQPQQKTFHTPNSNVKPNIAITTAITTKVKTTNDIIDKPNTESDAVITKPSNPMKSITKKSVLTTNGRAPSLSNENKNLINTSLKPDESYYENTIKQQNYSDFMHNNIHCKEQYSKVLTHSEVPSGTSADTTAVVDLFAESPPKDIQPLQQQHQEAQSTHHCQQSQIKRKPVNLFDDDDFQSFMSEIHQKTAHQMQQNTQNVINIEPGNQSKLASLIPTTDKSHITKPLFDDDDNDDDDDFFNIFANNKTNMAATKTITPNKTKTLFDDDDNNQSDNDNNTPPREIKQKTLRNFSTNTKNVFDYLNNNDNSDYIGGKFPMETTKNNNGNEDILSKLDISKFNYRSSITEEKLNNTTSTSKENVFNYGKEDQESMYSNNYISEILNINQKALVKEGEEELKKINSENTFSEINAKAQEQFAPFILDSVKQSNMDLNFIRNKEAGKVEESINYNDKHETVKESDDIEANKRNSNENNNNNNCYDNYITCKEKDPHDLSFNQNINNVTITTTAAAAITTASSVSAKPFQFLTNNYHLNASLFLDEPPDDSAFFENLSPSSSLSTSLNTQQQTEDELQQKTLSFLPIEGHKDEEEDIQQDQFYVPELPKLSQMSNNLSQKNTLNKNQQQQKNLKLTDTLSAYRNLQLFNEIPPDDDDAENSDDNIDNYDDNIGKSNNTFNTLPNIFYDDFNETLEALNEQQGKIINGKETVKVKNLGNQDSVSYDINNKSLTTKDQTSDGKSNTKSFSTQCDKGIKTNTEEKENEKDDDNRKDACRQIEVINAIEKTEIINEASSLIFPTNNMNKIQLPNIHINVKALLPKVQPQSPLLYVKQEQRNQQQQYSKIAIHNYNEIEGDSNDNAVETRATDRSYLLTNVTKNRIKIPKKRREWTRKARQESYKILPHLIGYNYPEEGDMHNPKQIENNSPMSITTSTMPAILDKEDIKMSNTLTAMKSINLTNYANVKQLTNNLMYQGAQDDNDIKESISTNTKNIIKTKMEEGNAYNKFRKILHIDDAIDDDDWNDLFVTNTTKTTQSEDSQIKMHSTMTTNNSSSSFHKNEKDVEAKVSDQCKTKFALESQISIKAQYSTPTTLFSSSDNEVDDDDDLFSALAEKTKKTASLLPSAVNDESRNVVKRLNENQVNKKTSLFSDSDNDDEDGMFTKRSNAKLIIAATTKQQLSTNKNIFGDDETDSDDADLFSGTTKKSTKTETPEARVNAAKTTPKDTKRNVTISDTTVIKNNPLADLL